MKMFIIAVISFVSMVAVINEINEMKRDILVNGVIQIRGERYSCQKEQK